MLTLVTCLRGRLSGFFKVKLLSAAFLYCGLWREEGSYYKRLHLRGGELYPSLWGGRTHLNIWDSSVWEPSVFLPIYLIMYLHQHGLWDACFILWVTIQSRVDFIASPSSSSPVPPSFILSLPPPSSPPPFLFLSLPDPFKMDADLTPKEWRDWLKVQATLHDGQVSEARNLLPVLSEGNFVPLWQLL